MSSISQITYLPKLKESDSKDLMKLLTRWKSELAHFEAIDPGYNLGIFQRRNIIYRALPDSVQKEVDKENTKEAIETCDEFMTFVQNPSSSGRYQSATPPKPLTANVIEEEATSRSKRRWMHEQRVVVLVAKR